MTEDRDAKESQIDSGIKSNTNKAKDKKTRAQRPLTKIILRRLPPTMTEEAFLEQVSPIPEHDHFSYAKPDSSLGNNLFSRAYINFVNVDDIYLFRDKFDGYVFLDEKGVEYVGIVEYAPFQRIPKKKKKRDPKVNTIESDPIYQEFIENLNKDQETDNQPKLEYSYPVNDTSDKKVQSTPLLEYLAARKQDKRGRDERRRRENDKRKMRIERKVKEPTIKEDEIMDEKYDVKKIKSRDWERDKSKSKDDVKIENKEAIFESKFYKERRTSTNIGDKKKIDKRDDDINDDGDKLKKDKFKESPRELKSKKYSDSRKERIKIIESMKIDKLQSSKPEVKLVKVNNHDDIKPFTQLPQVKTDDLTRLIEEMDRKVKLEASQGEAKDEVSENTYIIENLKIPKIRRNSLDSGDLQTKDEITLKRQKSLDVRDNSSERDDSEEKEKSEERRAERRIRNKDRPSLVIYQPGMGKFSKQRLAKDSNTKLSNDEKKDT